jgi:hypothetical protein
MEKTKRKQKPTGKWRSQLLCVLVFAVCMVALWLRCDYVYNRTWKSVTLQDGTECLARLINVDLTQLEGPHHIEMPVSGNGCPTEAIRVIGDRIGFVVWESTGGEPNQLRIEGGSYPVKSWMPLSNQNANLLLTQPNGIFLWAQEMYGTAGNTVRIAIAPIDDLEAAIPASSAVCRLKDIGIVTFC